MLQALEIGNDVNAVDAAVGPEVEKDNFAFERGERKWLVGVKPATTACQLRRTHPSFFLSGHNRSPHCV